MKQRAFPRTRLANQGQTLAGSHLEVQIFENNQFRIAGNVFLAELQSPNGDGVGDKSIVDAPCCAIMLNAWRKSEQEPR